VPRYWDEQLRIDHELSPRWKLTLSNIGTDDIFELFATKDENAQSKRFYNRTRFARLSAAARYKHGPWLANFSLSTLAQQFLFEAGLYQSIDVRDYAVTPRADVTHTSPTWAGLKDVVWRFGGEAQVTRGVAELALPQEQREGEPPPAYDPKDVSSRFKGAEWLPDPAAWSSVTASLDPRIRGTLGLRAEYFGRAEELVVQPRGEL